MVNSPQVNELTFERVHCEQKDNNTIISDLHCEAKYIKRGFVRTYAYVNFSQPIHDCWVHFVSYYRYNPTSYQKFPVNLWENPCDWLKGKKSWLLDWSVKRVLKYTNINHPCPYDGHVYFKADNISTNIFNIEQLIPAGRYRIDAFLTDGSKTNVLAKGQLYFSVSDVRVERFW